MDKTGKMLIDPSPSFLGQVSDGLIVREAGWAQAVFGYVDIQGNWVLPPTYLQALPFSEGLAAVKVRIKTGNPGPLFEDFWTYIDRAGQVSMPQRFQEARPFHDGLACVRVKKQPSYNLTLEQELQNSARSSRWGYINRSGDLLCEPVFYEAGDYNEGIAWGKLPGQDTFFFFDKSGQVIADGFSCRVRPDAPSFFVFVFPYGAS